MASTVTNLTGIWSVCGWGGGRGKEGKGRCGGGSWESQAIESVNRTGK